MIIKYFIPEDGDDQNHPNVFLINSNSITLNDIVKNFPLPGNFHFRFFKQLANINVWMDLSNLDELVPILQNSTIFAKVSRIKNVCSKESREPNIKESSPKTNDKLNLQENQTQEEANFIPVEENNSSSNINEQSPNPEDDLLGFENSYFNQQQPPNQSQNTSHDPFGFETLEPIPKSNNNHSHNPLLSGNNSFNRMSPMMNQPMNGSTSGFNNSFQNQAGQNIKRNASDPFGGLTNWK